MEVQKQVSVSTSQSGMLDSRETSWSPLPAAGPWTRYAARFVDIMVLILPAVLLAMGLSAVSQQALAPLGLEPLSAIFMLAGLASVFPFEGMLLSRLGQTPGKALAGIRVRTLSGARLSFGQATKRSFQVWCRGSACGLSFLSLIANYLAKQRLEECGATSWDEGRFRVEIVRPRAAPWCVTFVIGVTIVAVLLVVAAEAAEVAEEVERATSAHAAVSP